jgi:hypothetical protein
MPYLSSRKPAEALTPISTTQRYRGHLITIVAMAVIVGAAYLGSMLITYS